MTASVPARANQSQSKESRSPTSAERRWNLEPREAAILATILAATALIYMPSVGYGWIWDDKAEIVQKSELQSWAGIAKSFITTAGGFAIRTIFRKAPITARSSWCGSR